MTNWQHTLTRRAALTLLLLPVIFWHTVAHADEQRSRAQPALPSITLDINGVSLQAEVARTGQQRYMGLSFRTELADNAGMLFVYEREQPLVFTMRNTLLPLSIAFVSESMEILEILDMNVGPNQLFPSQRPARFALEVNQGWFERNGIKPGMRLSLQ